MKDCKKCIHWDVLVSCKLEAEITEYIDCIDLDEEYTDLDCLSFIIKEIEEDGDQGDS